MKYKNINLFKICELQVVILNGNDNYMPDVYQDEDTVRLGIFLMEEIHYKNLKISNRINLIR